MLNDGADSWVQIQSPTGAIGYVARNYLSLDKRIITLEEAYGGASASTTATCVEAVGVRNGAVLEQRRKGRHKLRIENGTDADGVVKLKSIEDRTTILALYVATGQTAEVATVPDGTFRVMFATGSRWSKNCDRFLDDMQAMRFDRDETLHTRLEGSYEYHSILTYTLHRVADGNAPATRIPPEDF